MPIDVDKVQKPVRKLRKLLKRMDSKPAVKDVHDLRTNTRRLEAALQAAGLDSKGKTHRLLKDLARLRKRAGRVRDLDVLTGFAAGLKAKNEDEDPCQIQLLEHLGAERHKKAKRLYAEVAKRNKAARALLKSTCKRVEGKLDGSNGRPPKAASQTAACAIVLEAELATRVRLTRGNLHPYRLKVKELRNVLKMAEGNSEQPFIAALGEVKDAIGEWHDWEELLSIANEAVRHGQKCDLLQQIRAVAQQEFSAALEKTESMRKRFLRVNVRKPSAKAQPAKLVWQATRAIAA